MYQSSPSVGRTTPYPIEAMRTMTLLTARFATPQMNPMAAMKYTCAVRVRVRVEIRVRVGVRVWVKYLLALLVPL